MENRLATLARACVTFVLVTSAGAWSQSYPSKPVRYIVGGSAGSGTDTIGRIVAEGMAQAFGRQVIVENRPGGGSNIAAEAVAKAPPDGHTMLQTTMTHTVNVTLYRKLSYSLTRDFSPVTLLAIACLALSASATIAAERDAYPTRPVRILVPQSPGGTTDLTARLIAPHLAERLGQSVIVDNRPGAGSLLGTELAAKAAPDGYTLLVIGPSLTVMPSLHKNVPFDPVKDFAPITTLSQYPNVLLVHPSLPVNDVKGLIGYAKSKPGELNYASGGPGTGTHLGAELFKMAAGVDIVHVPYKGGGPALNALMAGQVQIYFAALPSTTTLLKAGKLKPLAVTSTKRASAAPELPTIAESGLPGFEQITWNGMLAPAHTPRPIVERLQRDAHAVINLATSRERFAAQGADIGGLDPDAFAALIRRELTQWARVIKQAKIKADS